MSRPLSIFKCSKCKFEQSYSYGGKIYYYKLQNGDKIPIKKGPGWCFNCKTVTHLHLGMSSDLLKDEILTLENQIAGIKKKKSIFRSLTKFEKQEIEKFHQIINNNKMYLSVLNNQSSVHGCMECGGLYVFPLNFDSEFTYSFPSKTSYLHPNCEGQLLHEYSEFRIRLKTDEVFVSPLFLKTSKETLSTTSRPIGPDEIPNYEEVTQMISTVLNHERNLLENHQDKLFGFYSTSIIDKNMNTQFMIERFLFIYSYFKHKKKNIDLELMLNYVSAMASKKYNIEMDYAYYLSTERTEYYLTELDLLNTLEHPHPGKIVWSLYNPSLDKLSNEMDDKFEDNLLGGMFLFRNIIHVIEELCTKSKFHKIPNN